MPLLIVNLLNKCSSSHTAMQPCQEQLTEESSCHNFQECYYKEFLTQHI